MFADENSFFTSTSLGSSDFLSTEPRKSLGGLGGPLGSPMGAPAFGGSDEISAHAESFSQDQPASQRGATSGGAHQTPDGCVCTTVGMLRRAIKARTGGGPLQLNGRDVGLLGLCGGASGLDIRASMFKFTLEDMTGKIDVECSNKGALADLNAEHETPKTETFPTGSNKGLAAALEGGVVVVYGFPCTDDKGEVYVDCFKVNIVSDMREYVELFPLRIIAGAIQGGTQKEPVKTEAVVGGPAASIRKDEDDSALQMYEHVTDPAQRTVLKYLVAAKGQAVKRLDISSNLSGYNASAVEAALLALEESGEVALTSTWVSLAS